MTEVAHQSKKILYKPSFNTSLFQILYSKIHITRKETEGAHGRSSLLALTVVTWGWVTLSQMWLPEAPWVFIKRRGDCKTQRSYPKWQLLQGWHYQLIKFTIFRLRARNNVHHVPQIPSMSRMYAHEVLLKYWNNVVVKYFVYVLGYWLGCFKQRWNTRHFN